MGAAKKKRAKKASSRSSRATSRRGQKAGAKLPRRAKGVVRGSAAAARRRIKTLLAEAAGLSRDEASEIEDRYTTLGAALDRVRKLVKAGTATTSDHDAMLRTERAMARIEKQLAAQAPEAPLERIDASDRVAFCERHLTMPDGGPFEIAGREWQRDQFWAPLDGFRLWPVDKAALCSGCSGRAGQIIASVYEADETRAAVHREAQRCAGLHAHVIWLVLLQLKRQQGKTSAVAGYAVSGLLRHARESIAYVSGSEDQSASLFDKNFGRPAKRDPALDAAIKVLTTKMEARATGSEFAIYPTSLAGATGGTRTLVIVDEARDVPGSIFTALVPTIYARNGWRCPSGLPGHAWSSGDLQIIEHREGTAVDPAQERYGQRCTVCSSPLEPWMGRVAAMSSAQELDGSDADWFHEACETLEAEPQPDAHVFRSTRVLNPKVSAQLVSRTEQVLSKVRGLSDSIAIEAGGVSRRKGEPFLTDAQIKAVMPTGLVSRDSGSRPAVGFLDTSETTELTSLVILEDDSRDGEAPWHRLVQAHLKVWDPKDYGGLIPEAEVEAYVLAVVPRFGLLELRIDDRLRPWAKALRRRLKTTAPFKRIVRGCDEKGDKWATAERSLGWEKFEERVAGETILLIDDPRTKAELKAARKLPTPDRRLEVREQSRRQRHLDIAEGVASCCLMAHELAVKPTRPGLAQIENRGRSQVTAMLRRGRIAPRAGDY
jgi:hypothetical protein